MCIQNYATNYACWFKVCLHIEKYNQEVLSGLCECLKWSGGMKIQCRINCCISLMNDVPEIIYLKMTNARWRQEKEIYGDTLYVITTNRKGTKI